MPFPVSSREILDVEQRNCPATWSRCSPAPLRRRRSSAPSLRRGPAGPDATTCTPPVAVPSTGRDCPFYCNPTELQLHKRLTCGILTSGGLPSAPPPGEEAVVTLDRPRPSSARSSGPAPAIRAITVRPPTRPRPVPQPPGTPPATDTTARGTRMKTAASTGTGVDGRGGSP